MASVQDSIKRYSLPVMHGVALVGHVISVIFAFQTNEKDDQISFAITEVNENGTIAPMTGVLGELKPMMMLATSDIIVIGIMAVHLARHLMGGQLAGAYSGSMGMLMSFLHVAAYSVSHFLALMTVYFVAGYRDDVSLYVILASIVGAEAVQHMVANPRSTLSSNSKRMLAVVSAIGLLVAAIRIGLTLWTRDDNGLQGGIDAFVFLVAAEALKVINEIFTQSQKSGSLIKEEDRSAWSKAVDSRHVHVVLDLVIKVLLVWHLNLSNYIAESATGVASIDDLKSYRTTTTWVTIIFPGVFLLYCVAAMYKAVPPLLVSQSFQDFPSATLDEKERMLQVA